VGLVRMHWPNYRKKVTNIAYITLLTRISDEFRPILVSSIPKLVTLLSNSNVTVRLAAVDALAKLSEKGKIKTQNKPLQYPSADQNLS
jgi:hypothetical protein